MRFILLALLLGFSSLSDAQLFRGGDRDDMRDAVDCLDSVGRDALEDFGDQAQDVADEIQDLCDEEDDEGARDVAMDYLDELADSRELRELEECSEIIRDSMPLIDMAEFPSAETYEEELDDICGVVD